MRRHIEKKPCKEQGLVRSQSAVIMECPGTPQDDVKSNDFIAHHYMQLVEYLSKEPAVQAALDELRSTEASLEKERKYDSIVDLRTNLNGNLNTLPRKLKE